MLWRRFREVGLMTAPIAPVSALAVPFRHRHVRRSDTGETIPARAAVIAEPRSAPYPNGDEAARTLLAATVLAQTDPWAAAAARAAYRAAGRLGRSAAPDLKAVA